MKKIVLMFFSFLAISQTVSAETISGEAFVNFAPASGYTSVSISVAPQPASPMNGTYKFIIQDDHDYPRYITATITGPGQTKNCTLTDSSLTVTGVPVINYHIAKLRQLQTINPNVGSGKHMLMNFYDNPNWDCSYQFLY